MIVTKIKKRVYVVPESQFIEALNSMNEYLPAKFVGIFAEVVAESSDIYTLRQCTDSDGLQDFNYLTDDGGRIIDLQSGARFVVMQEAWK